MPYGTSQISVITTNIITLLQANQTSLGLADIWDGDMANLPRTPCVAVVAGQKERVLNGEPLRTAVTHTVYLLIYHDKLQDVQVNYRGAMVLAESIEALLHVDPYQGGILQHSMVVLSEPGFAVRSRSVLRTTRLTWQGVAYNVGALT